MDNNVLGVLVMLCIVSAVNILSFVISTVVNRSSWTDDRVKNYLYLFPVAMLTALYLNARHG